MNFSDVLGLFLVRFQVGPANRSQKKKVPSDNVADSIPRPSGNLPKAEVALVRFLESIWSRAE